MAEKISKPIIRVPITLQRRNAKRLDKLRAKELEAKHSKYHPGERNLPPIIHCRRPELNHYKNQTYSPFKRLPLASEHWMSRSTIGDFFAFAPYRGSSAETWHKYVPSPYDNLQFPKGEEKRFVTKEKPSFKDYDLDPRIIEVRS